MVGEDGVNYECRHAGIPKPFLGGTIGFAAPEQMAPDHVVRNQQELLAFNPRIMLLEVYQWVTRAA